MKKQYQDAAQLAVNQFREWATQNEQEPIQLSFPTPDIVKLAEQNLGDLVRHVGKMFIEGVLSAEAEQIVGPRSKADEKRKAYRWGIEQGYCVIDGQKVPIARPPSADGSIDVFAAANTDFLLDINGYFAPDNGQGLYYFPVTQCRAQESTLYADSSALTINVPTAGNCTGIPATAKGYAINVTAIPGGSAVPFVTVYPTGQGRPNASILNAFEGQTVTGGGIVPAGTNGAIDVYAFKRTNIVVDVSGFFSR